jgi:hypothetical protein
MWNVCTSVYYVLGYKKFIHIINCYKTLAVEVLLFTTCAHSYHTWELQELKEFFVDHLSFIANNTHIP